MAFWLNGLVAPLIEIVASPTLTRLSAGRPDSFSFQLNQSSMKYITKFYPESRFGDFTDVDGTITFFCRVNSLLKESDVVLDLGCGRGEYQDDPVAFRRSLRVLRGKAAKVIGIDVDEHASTNPFVDEFRLIQSESWPVEDDSIDLLVCDYVLEHIEKPEIFFSEIRRVLKHGGHLCLRTANRWGYVAIASSLIPNRFHASVTSKVQGRRQDQDVFPTFYRCNSTFSLSRIMKKHGISGVAYCYESEPRYLCFSKVAFYLGVLYQRFSPRFFRTGLFAFGRIDKSKG